MLCNAVKLINSPLLAVPSGLNPHIVVELTACFVGNVM